MSVINSIYILCIGTWNTMLEILFWFFVQCNSDIEDENTSFTKWVEWAGVFKLQFYIIF